MRVQCRDPSFISDVGMTPSQTVRSVVTKMDMKCGYLFWLMTKYAEVVSTDFISCKYALGSSVADGQRVKSGSGSSADDVHESCFS